MDSQFLKTFAALWIVKGQSIIFYTVNRLFHLLRPHHTGKLMMIGIHTNNNSPKCYFSFPIFGVFEENRSTYKSDITTRFNHEISEIKFLFTEIESAISPLTDPLIWLIESNYNLPEPNTISPERKILPPVES